MNNRKLKIAIVVPGRFFAFDLARELIAQGHSVTVFTNYPKFGCKKFGIPARYVKSYLWHGIQSRLAHQCGLSELFGLHFQSAFSKWAARNLNGGNWDILAVFSGVGLDVFSAHQNTSAVRILIRGSSHIRYQSQLLEDEEKRAKVKIDRPTEWMMTREEREYQLADYIWVLSDFCRKSFIERGFPEDKLFTLAVGTNLTKFRPSQEVIKSRCDRLLAKQRLKVLMVGTFSYQKGAVDFSEMASLAQGRYEFCFVGPIAPEALALAKEYANLISFIPKTDEALLHQHYARADIFVFPTIQDGYPAVLAQALASALPILTTANSSGPDLVLGRNTGWILPIRDAKAFLRQLDWCDSHRIELCQMVKGIYENFHSIDCKGAAEKFASLAVMLKIKNEHPESRI